MSTVWATKIAEALLKINAVKLNPRNPYTWASGWKSPIYCDNRLTLSYPDVRNLICEGFCEEIRQRFPHAGGIAGVATAGIPHGMLVADRLGLPFLYVRSAPKGHGLGNQIEGRLDTTVQYVVIEDLVSTGGSSLKAVEALRAAGGQVAGLISVFNYGFPEAVQAFEAAGVTGFSLSDLEALLHKATEFSYLQPGDLEAIRAWRTAPAAWNPVAL